MIYGFYGYNVQYRRDGLKIRFSGKVCMWRMNHY